MRLVSIAYALVAGWTLALSGVSLAQEEMESGMVLEYSVGIDDTDAGVKKPKKAKKNKKDADSPKKAQGKPEPPAVVQALKKFKMITGKPNANAEFYIYLYSASWCGYCRECMPVAVEQYKQMRRTRKVEIILICGDKSEAEAKDYVRSSKYKFPTMMFSELQATKFRGLPGCGMPGFPALSVVAKDGTMIANVVGAAQVKNILENWKTYTIERK